MVELDRINYPGFSKEYVMQRFQIALDSKNAEALSSFEETANAQISPEQMIQEAIKTQKGLYGKAIRKAYRMKALLKRIPVLRKIGIRIKTMLIKKVYLSMRQKKDISSFLNYELNDFITMIYRVLLDREPDSDGFALYQHLLCWGVPREAMVCMIDSSPEFAQRYSIVNIKNYRKKYKNYKFKAELKKLPIIGWYVLLRKIPGYFAELRLMDAQRINRERNLKEDITWLRNVTYNLWEKANATLEKQDTLKTDVELLKAATISLSEKSDTMNKDLNTTQKKIYSDLNDFQKNLNEDINWLKAINVKLSEKANFALQKQDRLLQRADVTLQNQDTIIGKADITLQKQDGLLERADVVLQKQDTIIGKADVTLQKQDGLLERADVVLQKQDTIIGKADITLQKQDGLLERADVVLQKQDTIIGKTGDTLQKQDWFLEKADATLQKQDIIIGKADVTLQKQDELLDGNDKTHQEQCVSLDKLYNKLETAVSKAKNLEYALYVQRVIDKGLSLSPGLESVQSELISHLPDKNDEFKTYNQFPIEHIAGYADGRTVVAGYYSWLISDYAANNNLTEIEAVGIEPSYLPDACKGKDTLIISNPTLSALVLTSPNLLSEISQKLSRNLILAVRVAPCPIHISWDGFHEMERENNDHLFRWADGANDKWRILLHNPIMTQDAVELRWSANSLCNAGKLIIACNGEKISTELDSNKCFSLNVTLYPGDNEVIFTFSGQKKISGRQDPRLLSFRIANFSYTYNNITIRADAASTYIGNKILLNDNYVRSTLHNNGFYDVSSIAYANHGFKKCVLEKTRYEYPFNYKFVTNLKTFDIEPSMIVCFNASRLRKTDGL